MPDSAAPGGAQQESAADFREQLARLRAAVEGACDAWSGEMAEIAAPEQYLPSLLWSQFKTAETAARRLFGSAPPPELGEALGRVARGESLLLRMAVTGPVAWVSQPVFTCSPRAGGGVDVFLGDLAMLAPTQQEALARIEATARQRPKCVLETWRIDAWPYAEIDVNGRRDDPLGGVL